MMRDKFDRNVIRAIAVALSLFHLYTAYQGTFYPYVQRSIPLLLAVILAFLMIRAYRPQERNRPVPWYDWALVLLAVPAFGFAAINSDYLSARWPLTPTYAPTTIQLGLAVLAALLVMEAARRTMGWVLVFICLAALSYTYLGEYVGWKLLGHRGFSFEHIVDHMYLTLEGLWGVALGVAATYITLFIIFGAFAEKAGATDFFVRLSIALTGHTRGGPAKVAVFSSGLIGSVTGSTVANVYTTGQFTIPLMQRLGYRSSTAGAVEALASNGGQIMPPVMGAAAFLIAAYSGVPYVHIALVSLVPAIIYFGVLLWFVHLEACKSGLVGVPLDEKPPLLPTLMKGGHLLSPLALLIALLAWGQSPMRAAFFSILFTIAISWFRKETRIGPRELIEALENGARNSVMIIVICAAVGFVIGAFTLTGLGLNASSAIIHLSGGSFFLLLLLVGVACIVLGTGMNTVAAYILVSVIAVPALTKEGVDPLIANMFVFYFSLLSHITPPVCLAIFAAASVAKANPWTTAFAGMKMGVVAYLLPFLIVYAPGLMMFGSAWEIVLDIVTTIIGSIFLVSAIQGWFVGRLSPPFRLLMLVTAVLLIWPSIHISLAGGGLAFAFVLLMLWRQRQLAASGDALQEPAPIPVVRNRD